MPPLPTDLVWIKGSRSYATSSCLELAAAGHMIALRDSKNPGIQLLYTVAEMDAFIDGAKRGEFDHLIGGANVLKGGVDDGAAGTVAYPGCELSTLRHVQHSWVWRISRGPVIRDRMSPE